jgi:hypothetical protein
VSPVSDPAAMTPSFDELIQAWTGKPIYIGRRSDTPVGRCLSVTKVEPSTLRLKLDFGLWYGKPDTKNAPTVVVEWSPILPPLAEADLVLDWSERGDDRAIAILHVPTGTMVVDVAEMSQSAETLKLRALRTLAGRVRKAGWMADRFGNWTIE